jgi:hypothetical protein
MMLLKYVEFITESRSEVLLPSIFLKDFINKIDQIDSKISTEFKKIVTRTNPLYRQPHKWTFISVDDIGEKVIFSESYKVSKWIEEHYGEESDANDILKKMSTPFSDNTLVNLSGKWSGTHRVEMKIGRFIKGYFGDKFSDSEIENFVNQWKSLEENCTFEIWEKSDIINGYRSKIYHFNDYDNGYNPLMNSCMNDESSIAFYQYCPSVKLLVLLDFEKRILGRALLWVDNEGRKIMDRIYYVYDKDYFKFVRWANENDYWYKKGNTGVSKFVKNGKEEVIYTKVKIMNVFAFPDEEYPYLDTFSYFQGEWAYNYQPNGKYWRMINTDGSYDIFDYEDTDYEEVNN